MDPKYENIFTNKFNIGELIINFKNRTEIIKKYLISSNIIKYPKF